MTTTTERIDLLTRVGIDTVHDAADLALSSFLRMVEAQHDAWRALIDSDLAAVHAGAGADALGPRLQLAADATKGWLDMAMQAQIEMAGLLEQRAAGINRILVEGFDEATRAFTAPRSELPPAA